MRRPEAKTPEIYTPVTITERTPLSENITVLRFNKSLPQAEPGQYMLLWLPHFDEKPFMISNTSPLEIIVETKGPFTSVITQLQFADKLFFRGPFGSHFLLPEKLTDTSTIIIDSIASLSAARGLLQSLLIHKMANIKVCISQSLLPAVPLEILSLCAYQTFLDAKLASFLEEQLPFTEYLYFSATSDSQIKTIQQADNIHPRLRSAQGLFVTSYIACAIGICGRCAQNGFLAGTLPCMEGPVFEILQK